MGCREVSREGQLLIGTETVVEEVETVVVVVVGVVVVVVVGGKVGGGEVGGANSQSVTADVMRHVSVVRSNQNPDGHRW